MARKGGSDVRSRDFRVVVAELERAAKAPLAPMACFVLPLMEVVLGLSFGVLFLNSLKQVTLALVVHALFAMEVALLVMLLHCHWDMGSRRRKDERAARVIAALRGGSAEEALLREGAAGADEAVLTISAKLSPASDLSFHPTAAVKTLVGEGDKKGLSSATAFQQEGATALKALRGALAGGKLALYEGWEGEVEAELRRQRVARGVEMLIVGLNWVAFLGYTAICLTFYFPGHAFYKTPFLGHYPGDDAFVWWGNFAGDAAWTVEPGIILLQALIVDALLPRAPKAKAD